MTSKEFIAALEDLGMEPKAYSGRSMFGRYCVGVDVEYPSDAFRLGFEVAAASPGCEYPGDPNADAMGKGIVLYWPNLDWPE